MTQPYFIRLYDANQYRSMALVMAWDRQDAHRKAIELFEPGEGQSLGVLPLSSLVEDAQQHGHTVF